MKSLSVFWIIPIGIVFLISSRLLDLPSTTGGMTGEPGFSFQDNHDLPVIKRPSFYDNFCGNFTRNVSSSVYLNYVTRSTLRFEIYTQARFSHPTKFHFAIPSSPRHFKARRTIRRTWKKLFQPASSCSHLASLAFYIGKTADHTTATWLEREFRDNPDDMVLIDFCDAYENLPLKTFNVMNFVSEHIPAVDFVIKMDDDVMPNINLLSSCFGEVEDPEYGVYGWVGAFITPSPTGKYKVAPEKHANLTQPAFTYGPAYIVQRSVLPLLLHAALQTPVLNLEDVWFTGFVAEFAQVRLMDLGEYFLHIYRKPKEFLSAVRQDMNRALFFHDVPAKKVSQVWATYPQNCDSPNDANLCKNFRLIRTRARTNLSSKML